jgi:hypothetical protein
MILHPSTKRTAPTSDTMLLLPQIILATRSEYFDPANFSPSKAGGCFDEPIGT